MNAKLELYRRYYCVERNINEFSVLTEWATAYLIQQEYEDNIYELALAKNRKEALFLSDKILENVVFNNQNLQIATIDDNTSMFDALPNDINSAVLLGEWYNCQEYQIDSMLIYQFEFENKLLNRINKIFHKETNLSTFKCNRWIEKIYENRNKIREHLFNYLEIEYAEEFSLYKEASVLDYLYGITDISFNIKSNLSIISLRKSNFSPEEYNLPDLPAEYIEIVLDRDINIISTI
ncbi:MULTISPECIES: hypothetical protein [Haemophilus]|uniref:hypothetical protein n=1 Tax=Haemophilus TaxID=724 RepID=UPI0008A45B8F|nr:MULTISPECIES: hypothetical protein [Haemophilus]OFO65956.1 hypothetical protein HMPREF3020_08560 [Haemophilus sp. HMSC068C11]QOR24932.1 hypothetical protein INP90_01245 [Haemophilus parainfluenzae]